MEKLQQTHDQMAAKQLQPLQLLSERKIRKLHPKPPITAFKHQNLQKRYLNIPPTIVFNKHKYRSAKQLTEFALKQPYKPIPNDNQPLSITKAQKLTSLPIGYIHLLQKAKILPKPLTITHLNLLQDGINPTLVKNPTPQPNAQPPAKDQNS